MENQSYLIQLTGGDLSHLIENAVKNAMAEQLEPKQADELITRQQAADLIGVTLPTLHTYTRRGIIPTYRIGRNVRFKKSEIIESLSKVESLKYRR